MKITDRCKEFLKNMLKGHDHLINHSNATDAEAKAAILQSYVKMLEKPSIRERLAAYTRFSYLSGISTHVINAISQTMQIGMQPLLRASRGDFREAGAMLEGITTGFMEAFPRFVTTFKSRPFNLDAKGQKAFDISSNKYVEALFSYPIRTTAALDEGLGAVLERMEFNAMRQRIANKFPDEFFKRQGMSKDAFVKQLEDIALGKIPPNQSWQQTLADLSPELSQQLNEFKMFNSFRSRLGNAAIDKLAKQMVQAKDAIPELNLVVPFVTTPTNVWKEAMGYLPGLGMARVGQAKKDIKLLQARRETLLDKANNATNPDTQARYLEQAARLQGEMNFKQSKIPDFYVQQMMGAGLMFSAYSMVNSGVLTGHYSSDPAERQRQITAKIPPMSIKVTNPITGKEQWISYQKLEPVATVLGLVADTMQGLKEGRISGKGLEIKDFLKIVGTNMVDKTFTEGLSKLMLAMQESDRYAESFVVSLTNPIVPAIVNQIARLEDDVKREIRDPELANWIVNSLKSRIPVVRKELPAQVNLLGQEQDLGTVGGQVTGFNVEGADREAVNKLFDNPYLKITRTTRSVGGLELTGEQYAEMENRIGDLTAQLLQPYANNPGFNAIPRPLQAKEIKRVVTEVRKQERLATLGRLIQDPQQLAKYYAKELSKYGLQEDVAD